MLQLLGWCGQTGGMDAMQWFSDDLMIFRPPGLTANELVDVFCRDPPLCRATTRIHLLFSPEKRAAESQAR